MSTSLFQAPRHVTDLSDCYFYHSMELPGFGLVHGHWDLRGRFGDYTGGVEVAGKSVLDVGAATGFLSFEAERRGASRVVSHDMSDVRQQTLVPFRDKIHFRDRDAWAAEYAAYIERWKNAYWLCHRLYRSRAEAFYGDVYDLPPALGRFDVAIVGSLLEHLSDPVTALASIARLTKETVVVVTPLIESEERIARFEPRADDPGQDYTWWTYSLGLYREVFGILGFRVERVMSAEYFHVTMGRPETRRTVVAERV
jgi:SAM-dependent methyltransferase